MKFIRRSRANRISGIGGLVAGAAIGFAFTLAGCVSTLTAVKMAPQPVADGLGFPSCRVSVPLSQPEAIDDAKRIGNPHPESYPEWIAITKNRLPGDQLRLVDCSRVVQSNKVSGQYFYALIRDHRIMLKFYPMIFD